MSHTLDFVCVLVGKQLPALYVERLHSMLSRHVPRPFRLHVLTDQELKLPSEVDIVDISGRLLERPGMRRTTNKLLLFDSSFLPFHEFLFLDVTLVITKDMSPLIDFAQTAKQDLVTLSDWNYDSYNTCVMRVRHSEAMQTVVEDFKAGVEYPHRNNGDQDYTTASIRAHGLQDRIGLFPDWMVASYRNARELLRTNPELARKMLDQAVIVKFFGKHKMHQVVSPWFRAWLRVQFWKYGSEAADFWLDELRRHWR